MSVVYTTVNGQIICENRGGVVHHFVSDPLGSVVMVRDNAGNTVYEAEYDPYGNVQSETGANPSEFGYVGTLGYVKDSAFSLYVRARYLLTNLGRWLTKDPLWPNESGFVYAGAAPNLATDSFGTRPSKPIGVKPTPQNCSIYKKFCDLGYVFACNSYYACLNTGDDAIANGVRQCLQKVMKDEYANTCKLTCANWIAAHVRCFSLHGYSNPCTQPVTLELLCRYQFYPNSFFLGRIRCSDWLKTFCKWPTPYPDSNLVGKPVPVPYPLDDPRCLLNTNPCFAPPPLTPDYGGDTRILPGGHGGVPVRWV